MLKATFDEAVQTWKVQRHKGKNAFSKLVSSGTADSLEAAKAAARHVAEMSNNGLPDSAGG